MAGHSQAKNRAPRKKAQDAKRGKIFTKLIREITVAARTGGGDPATNPRLRAAVDKALDCNMTKDNIERAIKRGSGEIGGEAMEEIRYEGYGPGGVAVLVDCVTDNRNRTVADIRHAFAKCGGNLGTNGSVAYLFSKKGLLSFAPGYDENQIVEIALEAGVDDVVSNDDGTIDVMTSPENFTVVKNAMQNSHLTPASAEILMLASTQVDLDREDAEKMLQLQEMLEDLDDVQDVYSNANIPDELLNES
jgi:YebC/PmpR family DNA-binding regulatory protein